MAAAAEETRPALSYFASPIGKDKPHWFETPEGFRIYTDVPIARTGVQPYRGHELKNHRDYDPAWGLNDNEQYDVHRDPEEVLSPETIKSFEGKSVTEGHPPGDDLWLHTFSDGKYSRGHSQNVRKGPSLPSGETPLVTDLHVKDSDLNDKIDGGEREVSAGYTYRLNRDDSGRLSQREIRGNHVAVVPKGRAGRDIAIVDAAPQKTTCNVKESRMIEKNFKGWLLKLVAKDADPEDVEKVSNMLAEREASKQDDEPKVVIKDSKAGKDEEEEPAWVKALMDRMDKLEAKMSPKSDEAKDEDMDMPDEDDADMDMKKKNDKAEGDEAEELEGDAKGKSVFAESEAIGDSAVFLKAIAPMIAKSKNAKIQSGYRKAVKALRGKSATGDAQIDPLEFLTNPGAVGDASPQMNPLDFFRGKTYAEGKKLYDEAIASKGGK